MIKRWWRKAPVRCWVIKQVDEQQNTLHLCEGGQLATPLPYKEAARQLARGEYRGGVRIGDTGIVLNSALFEALVPWAELSLDDQYRAHWRGREWAIARVPQRCWAWEGRLIVEPSPAGSLPAWQSSEDVAHVRERADNSEWLSGRASFRSGDALEDPEKDIRDAIARNRARQAAKRTGPASKTRAPRADEVC
ncbi:hypothetical protein FEI13_16340 [Halomonas urmiana]|uniref:Uncharacterized protein n=1 Tax=Halomonas urmiana TaxID=490901 RepID=A0A5R8MCF3_9GAMM|nr:hypothetical protein [Halomonas urmiana]TLF47244.1 hypothetical protein FEI13_16340 [Halomonas urmiana]